MMLIELPYWAINLIILALAYIVASGCLLLIYEGKRTWTQRKYTAKKKTAAGELRQLIQQQNSKLSRFS